MDIKRLVDHYLHKYTHDLPKGVPGISRQALKVLQQYDWPGNVRELDKVIRRALILANEGEAITVRHLPDEVKSAGVRIAESPVHQDGLSLREHLARVEAEIIRSSMRKAAGNKAEAARMLGISYPNLLQKIKQYRREMDFGLE